MMKSIGFTKPSRIGSGVRCPWRSEKDNGRNDGPEHDIISAAQYSPRSPTSWRAGIEQAQRRADEETGRMLGFIEDCFKNIWRFFSGMASMPVTMGSAGFQPDGLLMATVTSNASNQAAWHSGGGVRNCAIPAWGLDGTPQGLCHRPYIVL